MTDMEYYCARAVERAHAGITYLDTVAEIPDWAERLEKPVNMASTKACVLAQLFGRFRDGARALMLNDDVTVALGFRGTTAELQSMREFHRYYEVLSATWETERRRRLGIS